MPFDPETWVSTPDGDGKVKRALHTPFFTMYDVFLPGIGVLRYRETDLRSMSPNKPSRLATLKARHHVVGRPLRELE